MIEASKIVTHPFPASKSFKDKTGQRFGRLTVISYAGKRGKVCMWNVKCDCGTEFVVVASSLVSGNTQACGCLGKERRMESILTHGETIGGKPTTEYKAWMHMRERCGNAKHPHFKDYGGRGINVCHEWEQSFEAFLKDMGRKPGPHLTLERKNNNLGYSPTNCTWATRKAQGNNTRRIRLITFNGKTQNLTQWAEEIKIKVKSLEKRLRTWDVARALTTPLKFS